MSNTLPKLTEFRNRAIRILGPFVEAQAIKNADLTDLKTEFESAFREELDRETRAIQEQSLTGGASPLTGREREVTVMVAQGLTNNEIAERLVLSVRTVEAHVTHALTKVGLRSRAQLAIWAMQQRLIAPGS